MQSDGYKRLRRKIIAMIFGFSLIPLLSLALFSHFQFRRAYNEKIISNLETTLSDKKKAIDMFLDERVSQLKIMANTHTLEELQGKLAEQLQVVQSSTKSFIDLGLINQNGDHVAYVGPYKLKKVNYKDQEWFHEVTLKGVYISDVFMGFRNYPHIIIAVLRREGPTTWILRATIDSNIFGSLVKSIQSGERGDAFLINRKGVLQTASRFNGPVLSVPDFPGNMVFGGTRIENREFEGRGVIVGRTWLSRTQWLLVVMEDPNEEFSQMVRSQSLVLVLLVAGVGLILCGAVLTTRSIIKRMIKDDLKKAELDATLMQSSKMASLGKLAAGVAHEVNNPLTLIRESAGWIKDLLTDQAHTEIENFEEIETTLNKIEMHVDRAKAVTHRMLGFARRMEPVQEDVDINLFTDQTLSFFESEALHRNISLVREFSSDLPPVATDTAQFQQVLLNIVENAIDAIDKDGAISVTTGLAKKGEELFVSIEDTGKGISEAKLKNIFDPFFTTKKVGEGTGLGLSIVFGIMEKLGGRIEVESRVGEGSNFTLYLPVK